MAQNKRHHYVPRFYLKNFSSDGKSINLWNLPSQKKILGANLKGQCYKNYFYGKNPAAEAELANVENSAAVLLQTIVRTGLPPPPLTDWHTMLIFYVLIQHARTTHAVDTLNELTDKMMKHVFAPVARAEGFDLNGVSINLREPALASVAMAAENYPLLIDLDYKLLMNKSDVEFVTSDNPVVYYNQLFAFSRTGSTTGLACRGLQIFFPIDPIHALLFFDDSVYTVGKRYDPIVNISQPRDVYEINTLQMCSAHENIYFHADGLDLEALWRKAAPFRRAQMATVRVFPGQEMNDRKEEFVAGSREDIRTNLALSFCSLTRRAKKWRDKFRRLKLKPAVVVRSQDLLDLHKEFLVQMNNNERKGGEFFEFLKSRERHHVR
jgi:uncharacterized protein DUF4238